MNIDLRGLVRANAALALGLVASWSLLDTAWTPPLGSPPDAATLAAQPLVLERVDLAGLQETLERPLFSSSRRPQPQGGGAAPGVEVVPNALDGVALVGIAGAADDTWILLRKGGRVTRLRMGQDFNGWQFEQVETHTITLRSGEERRRLELKRAPQPAAPPGARRNPVPRGGGGNGDAANAKE